MHVRTAAKRYDNGRHTGPGEWLDVIHKVNELRPGTFGSPTSTGPWWAGGYVEEYPDARVVHHLDDSVSIVGTTSDGDVVLSRAAAALDITAIP